MCLLDQLGASLKTPKSCLRTLFWGQETLPLQSFLRRCRRLGPCHLAIVARSYVDDGLYPKPILNPRHLILNPRPTLFNSRFCRFFNLGFNQVPYWVFPPRFGTKFLDRVFIWVSYRVLIPGFNQALYWVFNLAWVENKFYIGSSTWLQPGFSTQVWTNVGWFSLLLRTCWFRYLHYVMKT